MEGVALAVSTLGTNAIRATLLLLVALLLGLALRRSAATLRQALWAGAITGLLLLPAAGLVGPPGVLAWLGPPQMRAIGPVSDGLPPPPPAPWLPPAGVNVAPPLPQVALLDEKPQVLGAPPLERPGRWVPLTLG